MQRGGKTPSSLVRKLTLKKDEEHHDDEHDSGEYDSQPVEVQMIPPDQEKLSEKDLEQYHQRILTAIDPNVNRATCRFDYNELTFKPATTLSQLAVHFEMDGFLIHVDSEEAKEQESYIATHKDVFVEKKSVAIATEDDESKTTTSTQASAQEEETETDDILLPEDDKSLKNQFNYSERATQTFNNPTRDREVSTEPPPTSDFVGNVTLWEIYDTYLEDLEKQLAERAKQEKPKAKVGDDEKDHSLTPFLAEPLPSLPTNEDIFHSESMSTALRLMERLVNQNTESEIFTAYKYEQSSLPLDATSSSSLSAASSASLRDPTSAFQNLWQIAYGKAQRRTVTCLEWNRAFPDLLFVGFGSYDFEHIRASSATPKDGLICLFSLKNSQHPEYEFSTPSGVLCLDIHPQHPSLLVCGLYDGSVCVFDVRKSGSAPIFISEDPKSKHTDPVWSVRWSKEEVGKSLNFFSISSDGKVTNWILNKNELVHEDVIELKLVNRSKDDELVTETSMMGLAGGCSFDFNRHVSTYFPQHEHVFVVGTEEGSVQTYSKAYNSQLLKGFEGHHMAVYSARWNPFHPAVFLTCSADWTVKLWETTQSKPIMHWDLNNAVSDVAWAPFSSTVFAVVTSDAKVRLFDLSLNKNEEIGFFRLNNIVDKKKMKLTHVSFSPTEPVLCVGDDRGGVHILKLASHVCKMSAPTIAELDQNDEIEKLEKLMIIPDRDPLKSPWIKPKAVVAPKKSARKPMTARGLPSSPRPTSSTSARPKTAKKDDNELAPPSD